MSLNQKDTSPTGTFFAIFFVKYKMYGDSQTKPMSPGLA